MTREEILDKIVAVITKSFGLDASEIKLEASFIEDLGFDSIDAVDFAVGVEEETGVNVEKEDLEGLRTVSDAVELILRKLAQGEGEG